MATKRAKALGERMRRERRMRDKTLEQVAEYMGLGNTTISAYEKGKINITVENLAKYCEFLGVDYIELLHAVQEDLDKFS